MCYAAFIASHYPKGSSTTVDGSRALSVLCSLACVFIQMSTAYTEDTKQKQKFCKSQQPVLAPKLGRKAWGCTWYQVPQKCAHRYPRAVHFLWEVEPKSVETDLTPPSKGCS